MSRWGIRSEAVFVFDKASNAFEKPLKGVDEGVVVGLFHASL
jgi:hypothetical protein